MLKPSMEPSVGQTLTSDALREHDRSHQCPTTRVRVRDLSGTYLCLIGQRDADPPGSVPASWTVHQARHSYWGYLRKGQNGQVTREGYFTLSQYDFIYDTRRLARSEILGTLPRGAIVTVIRPDGHAPLGEGPMIHSEPSDHNDVSTPTTPPTPPRRRHRTM